MQRIQKVLMLCLLFACVGAFAQTRGTSGTSVTGTVLEQGTKVPVEFAVVILYPSETYTTTDKDGNFEFKKVDAGKSTIQVQFVGMKTIEQVIEIVPGKENVFNFEMQVENFRLDEVQVVATQSKAGAATASNISRQAMDHLQTSSLSDVMQLLPGVEITNPKLSSANYITIRNSSSLGTSIIVDGSPLSSNANMQVLAPSISGGAGGTMSGIDSRTVSTDNIESIEIIRGIPSVEYGDLNSGAVIIRSKAGKEPLSIRLKANPTTYQAAASVGFKLGENAGHLNISGDYAYNTSNLYEAYAYYQRFNTKALWSKKFGENWNTNTTLDLGISKDTRELNPDDLRTMLVTKGNSQSVRLNTNGTVNINEGWLNNISYAAAISYANKYDYNNQLLSNAESLHTVCEYDGAILSNVAGQDVYDINGKKITNIPASEAENWIKVLPYEYVQNYEILGKELNAYAQVKATFNKRWGKINNHILVGADYKTDGNLGEGKVYDDETPPFRNNSSDYSSYRKRPYYDIPFVHQLGLFLEDTYKHTFGRNELSIKAGARFDLINGKTAISPRINASMEIIPDILTIRGGWGKTAKAPTALMLYPERAFFNYNNYDFQDGKFRQTVATVRVFDTENPDLEIAKMRKAEVGIDLKLFDQYRFSVTGYDELTNNGYTLGKDLSSYRLVEFVKYKAVKNEAGGYSPEYEGTYNIFSTYAKPMNNGYRHNRGIEFELDLGRFDAIRTAVFLNGAWNQYSSRSNGYTFDQNSRGNAIESNVAVYEKGLTTSRTDNLITTLRLTHNIPEIGFVITLATQVNWFEKFWTEYGNDTMFIKYISYKDGKVYDFDPSKKNDPEFAYMFDARNENRFIVEQYFPTVTFNLNISKEIGDRLTASFFVNNMFNSRPLYESKQSPGSFTELLSGNKLFFGFDLKVNIF